MHSLTRTMLANDYQGWFSMSAFTQIGDSQSSKRPVVRGTLLCLAALSLIFSVTGCHHFGGRDDCDDGCGDGAGRGRGMFGRNSRRGPGFDRPFPLGQVTDSFWEAQQTNAEAADFIFYDHEFKGNTAELAPGAKKHLMSVALRLEHVPFPVVIEESPHNRTPELDQARRRMIIEQLGRLGIDKAEERVVISNAFAEGFTAIEGERAYYSTLEGSFNEGGGYGRRGGFGASYR
jgi:hypothetical protein